MPGKEKRKARLLEKKTLRLTIAVEAIDHAGFIDDNVSMIY